MINNCGIIILAGGMGKRMQSDIPKVICMVNGKPMLVKLIETVRELKYENIMIVVGKQKEIIMEEIKKFIDINGIKFIYQEEALGAGHAVQCCIPELKKMDANKKIMILNGDSPLIRSKTIKNLLDITDTGGIIITEVENPTALGRIIVDDNNEFIKIVEPKDVDDVTKNVKLINSGMYCVRNDKLLKYLPNLSNNNGAGEYYITDIIGMVRSGGNKVNMYKIPKLEQWEIKGANTPEQLQMLELFDAMYNIKNKI